MTANELIRALQAKVSLFNSGDIPLELDGKELKDVEIELGVGKNDYFFNINPIL